RSSVWKLDAPALTSCSNCGSLIPPHKVCRNCGFYKSVKVIDLDD
ncbi:MAG: 50S ribosomal protein L32, partial [Ruminococcus sp.]|nr:50S ribosomal protein L32 [Ruminococcus sp.]